MKINFLFLLAALSSLGKFSYGTVTKEDLYAEIKKNAGHWVRPVKDLSQTVKIDYGLALNQIIDFNPKAEMLSTLMWPRLCWQDETIPENWGDIKELRVQQEEIWTPDLQPYNDVGVYDTKRYRFLIPLSVTSEGKVCWRFPAPMTTTCGMDVEKFPFDKQVCEVLIGSYQYDGSEVELKCSVDGLELDAYEEHNQWDLESSSCEHRMVNYSGVAFSNLFYTVKLTRKDSFYVRNLILPTSVLLALSTLIFFIPYGERVDFGMTVLLALTVNLLMVIGFIPETSKTIPGLCNYFIVCISLSALAIIMACISVNILNAEQEAREGRAKKRASDDLKSIASKLSGLTKIGSFGAKKGDEAGGSSQVEQFEIQEGEPYVDKEKYCYCMDSACITMTDRVIGILYFIATTIYSLSFLLKFHKY